MKKKRNWRYDEDITQEHYDRYICKPTNEFKFDPQTSKFQKIQSESYHLSQKCFEASKSVLCSVCDSDVGIHRKKGICIDFCYTWYDMCMSDHFIVRSQQNNSLDFPNYDDPVALVRPLYEMVADVDEFCERMGFPVYDEPWCYSGVPVASKVHLNKQQDDWRNMFTPVSGKAPLDWNITQIYNFVTRNHLIFRPLYIGFSVIFMIMFICHFFNRYQMNIMQEDREEQRRLKKERLLKKKQRDKDFQKLQQDINREMRKADADLGEEEMTFKSFMAKKYKKE